MNSKKIKNAIACAAGFVSFAALVDVGISMADKDAKNCALKDIHVEMENLQQSQHQNYVNGQFSKSERDAIEKRVSQLKAQHKKLETPIETIFFGKRAYKCPICGD